MLTCVCDCVCLSHCLSISVQLCPCVCLAHLLLQYAVEDEDEHALQRVEDGEQVRHDHGTFVDVHQAESPGEAQQTQQGYGPDHPRPTEHRGRIGRRKAVTVLLYVTPNLIHSYLYVYIGSIIISYCMANGQLTLLVLQVA